MNLENPNKLQWKQQYIRKYRDLLGISNLKTTETQPFYNHITPACLDHVDKILKQRSQSMKCNDESFQSRNSSYSINRKLSDINSTKIYSASQMNSIIKHAKLCGLLHDHKTQNQPFLQQNRKYLEDVRNLQKSWHNFKFKQEESQQINKIPMKQSYQFKLNSKKRQVVNIQRLIQEQQNLQLNQNIQTFESKLKNSQD